MLWRFLRGDSGAIGAEYALILGIVGTVISGALFLLGDNISRAIVSLEDDFQQPGSPPNPGGG